MPSKIGGVLAMAFSIVILIALPFFFEKPIKGAVFCPAYKVAFWFFISNTCFLGWLGQKVMESPYQELGAIATLFYFLYFAFLNFTLKFL